MKLRLTSVVLAITSAWLLVVACGRDATPPKVPEAPPIVVREEAAAPTDAGSYVPPAIRLKRRGVNLSGAEFGTVPGKLGVDYLWPRVATVDFFIDRGFNHFRIPFKHERLQPALQGPLDADALARLKVVVSHATGRGATVLLDAQNNFRHGAGCMSSAPADPKCHVLTEVEAGDFWGRMANAFKDDPLVQINPANEPHDMSTEAIAALDQAVVREVRRVGFHGLVAAPGNGWAGAGHWAERFNGTTPSSEVMGRVGAGDDQVAFDVHLYLDADASGAGADCVSPTIGVERLRGFVAWLRANGRRGVVGEIAAPSTPTCELAIRNALALVEANYDVFDSWAYWGAGEWSFGSIATYKLSVGPSKPGPQLAWLEAWLPCRASPTDAGADAR